MNTTQINRPFKCTAEAIGVSALEMHSIESQRNKLRLSASVDLKEDVQQMLNDVPKWLPLAAEVMNISSDIKDYILSPVVSMPSDLANRNGQAFPYHQLSAWCPSAGMPMYATWRGKGVFEEHNSDDYTQARGIIFASMLVPMKNTVGNLFKVVKLLGVDRTRDAIMANNILTKKRKHWSMGAYAEDYECSICGNRYTNGSCEHVVADQTKPPEFKVFNNHLAYWNVINPIGFETSLVRAPAFASAEDTSYFTFA